MALHYVSSLKVKKTLCGKPVDSSSVTTTQDLVTCGTCKNTLVVDVPKPAAKTFPATEPTRRGLDYVTRGSGKE